MKRPIDEVRAKVAQLTEENDKLRGILGWSELPCIHCGLSLSDQGKCAVKVTVGHEAEISRLQAEVETAKREAAWWEEAATTSSEQRKRAEAAEIEVAELRQKLEAAERDPNDKEKK